MTRRRNNISVYMVNTEFKQWQVVLKRLNNTYNGEPRYEATLIDTTIIRNNGYTSAPVFRFTSHYMDEYAEAEFIVHQYEKIYSKLE